MTHCFLDYDLVPIHLSNIIFIDLVQLKIQFVRHAMSLHWTRTQSLALWMSCRWRHKATSVWEPQRVLRVAGHSIWRCGGIRKEDHGQSSRLIKYGQVTPVNTHANTHTYKNSTLTFWEYYSSWDKLARYLELIIKIKQTWLASKGSTQKNKF